jgi:predicted TIM-barrel fold metal-dependent hydrolase
MTIVDAHNHIYPDKIASRAVDNVGDFYRLNMYGGGTVEDLLSIRERNGITHNIVHSVALSAERVISINNFIAESIATEPTFIGFATMHQDFEDVEGEVARCIDLGLKGFKLHTDSQMVNLDDPRLMRLYEAIEGRLPLFLHIGDYRYDYSHPRRLKEILHTFPKLVVNAAHFGGWSVPDLGVESLADENCFVDVSSSMMNLGNSRSRELIEIYGFDRVMFGSDYPMWNPADDLNRLKALGFTSLELERILHHNAERFMQMDID